MYPWLHLCILITLILASIPPIHGADDMRFVVEFDHACDRECREKIRWAALEADCMGSEMENLGEAAVGNEHWMVINCTRGGTAKAEMIKELLKEEDMGVMCVEPDYEGEVQSLELQLYAVRQTVPWNVNEVNGFRTTGQRCPFSLLGDSVIMVVLDTGCTPHGNGFDPIKCLNFVGDHTRNYCKDGHGHGSHVAGVCTSQRYGVSPFADLACLRVLGDNGRGSFSNFIRAINEVAKFAMKTWKPCIVNLSLAGRRSQALNDAVKAAARAGVRVFIAAGNFNKDAREYSPASAADNQEIFAVGAHDRNGRKASFSNYGPLVKLTAPGVSILSNGKTEGSAKTSSGTSMAAPHVAAVCAILLSDGLQCTLENLRSGDVVRYSGHSVHKTKYNCTFF